MQQTLIFLASAYMGAAVRYSKHIKWGADAEGDPDAKGVIQSLEFSPTRGIPLKSGLQGSTG